MKKESGAPAEFRQGTVHPAPSGGMATFPSTRRDLPPSDAPALARWFDRKRWKFDDAEWFTAGEGHLAQGDLTDTRAVILKGVEGEIAKSDGARLKEERESLAQYAASVRPPAAAKPAPSSAVPKTSRSRPAAPRRPQPIPPAVQPVVQEDPDLTKRELIIAFALDTLTTVRGLAWTIVVTVAGFAAILTGHGDWVEIAILDLILTGLLLLYPLLLPLFALGQVIDVVKTLSVEESVGGDVWNFLVICGLLAVAWLGLRLILALIARVAMLAVMIGGLILVWSAVSPLFAAFSMPLATVSAGALLGAFYFAWLFFHVLEGRCLRCWRVPQGCSAISRPAPTP